jgi:uncharacterized protein YbjT (DUF2867 family)
MRILVSGGTGLVGGELVRMVLEDGHEVRCLVREESPNVGRLPEGVEVSRGDASETGSIKEALVGTDAFIHIAGIEYAPQVASAMGRSGVGRLLVVSSTSTYSAHAFRSGPILAGEKVIKESGLEWTILRPTMIYGCELDHNIHKLLRFLDRSPTFPIFGPGENLWQPVYYGDLARGLLSALESSESTGQSYDLPGRRPLAYRDLVRVAASALGRKVRLVHLPLEPVYRALKLAENVGLPLPLESSQVLRLKEDKAYPYYRAWRDLGYAPKSFEEGVGLEVERLREIGMVHG